MLEIHKRLPKDLWPVMLTPFHDDNSVDYKGLEILTDFYISNGAKGLFTNCLSSEMYQLSEEERLQVTSSNNWRHRPGQESNGHNDWTFPPVKIIK